MPVFNDSPQSANTSDNSGLISSAINAANSFISAVNAIQIELETENDQLKLDLHLAEVRLNTMSLQRDSLQSQLDACQKRKCNDHGIHDVNDLPAVIAGDLIVTENGGVQDPVSGMIIDPDS